MTNFCFLGTTSRRSQTTRGGFTLTEVAMVLGIVGLVLGSIWTASAMVYEHLRVTKAQTELLQIVQGVRSVYGKRTTIDTGDDIDETANLILAGVFPSDTYAAGSTIVNGPWSGSTIHVWSESNYIAFSSTPDSFLVSFNGIPVDACAALASVVGGSNDPSMWGILEVFNTSTYGWPDGGSVLTFPHPGGYPVHTYTSMCNGAGWPGLLPTISFAFYLNGN